MGLIYFSYTLSREYRLVRSRYSRLLFTSVDRLFAKLHVQEQSMKMTSQCLYPPQVDLEWYPHIRRFLNSKIFEDHFEAVSSHGRFSFSNIRTISHCVGTQEFPPRENGWFGQVRGHRPAKSTIGTLVADWEQLWWRDNSKSLKIVLGENGEMNDLWLSLAGLRDQNIEQRVRNRIMHSLSQQ